MSEHTWNDLAAAAVGRPLTDDEAGFLLWGASAFPFAPPRVVYEQIRHSYRHGDCCDEPMATCSNRRIERAARLQSQGRDG